MRRSSVIITLVVVSGLLFFFIAPVVQKRKFVYADVIPGGGCGGVACGISGIAGFYEVCHETLIAYAVGNGPQICYLGESM